MNNSKSGKGAVIVCSVAAIVFLVIGMNAFGVGMLIMGFMLWK